MWCFFFFFLDEGYSIQFVTISFHPHAHCQSICSSSLDRFIITPSWKLTLKWNVGFLLHRAARTAPLQMCPFRKQTIQCRHQLHNRAYRSAARLRCGNILWMKAERGSDHNKSEKGWTYNYVVKKQTPTQTGAHPHTLLPRAASPVPPGPAFLCVSLTCTPAVTTPAFDMTTVWTQSCAQLLLYINLSLYSSFSVRVVLYEHQWCL